MEMLSTAPPLHETGPTRSVTQRLKWAFQGLSLTTIITVIVALAGTWLTYQQQTERTEATSRAVSSLYSAAREFRELTRLSNLPDSQSTPFLNDLFASRFTEKSKQFAKDLEKLKSEQAIGDETIVRFENNHAAVTRQATQGIALVADRIRWRDLADRRAESIRKTVDEAIALAHELETEINLNLHDRLLTLKDHQGEFLAEQLSQLYTMTGLIADFNWFSNQIVQLQKSESSNELLEMRASSSIRLRGMIAAVLTLAIDDRKTQFARAIETIMSSTLEDDGLIQARLELVRLTDEISLHREQTDALNGTVRSTLNQAFSAMERRSESDSNRAKVLLLISAIALIVLASTAIFLATFAIWRLVLGDIAGRMEKLWRQTIRIANGQFDEPVIVDGNDEIATLGMAIEQSRLNSIRLKIADELVRVSEERLALAAQCGHLGILDWEDLHTNKAYFSSELAVMLGIGSASLHAPADEFLDRIHEDDRTKFDEHLARHMRSGEQTVVLCRLNCAGHQFRWSELALRADRDVHWQAKRLVIAVLDVDELIRVQEKLKEQANDLKRSNEELDRFAYVASHDLKSPLRAIADLTGWLAEDLDEVMDDDARESMELLSNRTNRLIQLLDDLLAFSRVGRASAEPVNVNVTELVEDAFSLAVGDKPFSLSIEPPLPVILTDTTPLHQVFFNLFTNAVKHHDREHGIISVRHWRHGGLDSFEVGDDGPGIEPNYQDRIFGMFTTLRPRDEVEGSGIGLAVIKKQVELFGGTIVVESDPAAGRGTRFIFTWKQHDKPQVPMAHQQEISLAET